jgi:Mce-associated membrane protein
MVVPPAHDQPAELTEGAYGDPRRSTTFRLALAGVLAVALRRAQPVDPLPDVRGPPRHVDAHRGRKRQHDSSARTSRISAAGVLAVALLLSLGTSVWLAATRGFEAVGLDRGAGELQAERDRVMSQTRQFMLRMGTYGPDQLEGGQLPEYRELVTEVITPKFATSFDQSVATAEQIVAQAGVSREADVFAAGVSTIDADSATALVAGSYPDNAGELRPQEPVPFRIQVALVKTEGEWLVDDFTPVTAAEQ